MSAYTIALFLHVTGVVGLFMALGVEMTCAIALRGARRVEQVRVLSGLMVGVERLFPISILLLLGAGLYMAITVWGFQTAWIDVALGSLLIIAPTAPLVNGPRAHAIKREAEAAADGPLTAALRARVSDPVLTMSHSILLVVTLGIVFLMTNKPQLVTSLATILIALALGIGLGTALRRAERRRLASANVAASAREG
ncbi:MAG: hypothetical protein OJF49_002628 [Ktedonobacterales bacterium]|jgi:hypothetical protein|nr:MAG: hypothetical protein OJF49_002628 [Ktedonobacterales bacterium]